MFKMVSKLKFGIGEAVRGRDLNNILFLDFLSNEESVEIEFA